MMTTELIDRARVPRAFWSAIERLDVKPPILLTKAGLSPALYLDAEASVTTSELFSVIAALEVLSPEPRLSLRLAHAMAQSHHTPALHAATHARTFRDGLTWAQGLKRLGGCEEMVLEEQGDRCTLYHNWPYATGPEPLTLVECGFMYAIELGRRGTGIDLAPIHIDIGCAGEADEALVALFGCQIRYGAPRNELVLRKADLDRPFPAYNPELLELLTPAVQASLCVEKVAVTTGERIKDMLKGRLAGAWPELSDVAHQLAMSERTMQRRIEEEGSSFRELLTEAKQELGRQLMTDPRVEVDEVAFLLGFKDTSSFYRAFREWESMTPSEWRSRDGGRRPAVKTTPAGDFKGPDSSPYIPA